MKRWNCHISIKFIYVVNWFRFEWKMIEQIEIIKRRKSNETFEFNVVALEKILHLSLMVNQSTMEE